MIQFSKISIRDLYKSTVSNWMSKGIWDPHEWLNNIYENNLIQSQFIDGWLLYFPWFMIGTYVSSGLYIWKMHPVLCFTATFDLYGIYECAWVYIHVYLSFSQHMRLSLSKRYIFKITLGIEGSNHKFFHTWFVKYLDMCA